VYNKVLLRNIVAFLFIIFFLTAVFLFINLSPESFDEIIPLCARQGYMVKKCIVDLATLSDSWAIKMDQCVLISGYMKLTAMLFI